MSREISLVAPELCQLFKTLSQEIFRVIEGTENSGHLLNLSPGDVARLSFAAQPYFLYKVMGM